MTVGRDYKRRTGATRQDKAKLRQRGLVLATLLVIALFAGLLAYLRIENPNSAAMVAGDSDASANSTAQSSQTKTATEQPPPKAKYDFYNELPRREVVITKEDLQTKKTTVAKPDTAIEPIELVSRRASSPPPPVESPVIKPQVATAGGYLIQAGAFSKQADADRLKAQLALLGISARVEPGVANNRTVHRVRIGPIQGDGKLQAMRKRLSDNNIDSMPIKVR